MWRNGERLDEEEIGMKLVAERCASRSDVAISPAVIPRLPRRLRSELALVLAFAGMTSVAYGDTQEQATEQPVELTVWQQDFRGHIGSKPIHVPSLRRIGDRIVGVYCYGACKPQTAALQLNGRWHNDALVLDEALPGASAVPKSKGHWSLRPSGGGWRGEWHSPNGKQRHSIALEAESAIDPSFELRLLAAFAPEAGEAVCDAQSPYVSAIRVYRHGQLLQTLETDSQGTCGMFLPERLDVNFDGYVDLTIALMMPAGPNIPHQSWLFDPRAQKFVDAPATLQEISSPEFDPKHRIVYHHWRGSCCSHGVGTYQWEGGELVAVDSQESHLVPVWRDGKLGYMYSVPAYVNGKIEFAPRIVRDQTGGLRLDGVDIQKLELHDEPFAWGPSLAVDVFALGSSGESRLEVSESMRWLLVDDDKGKRWCPDVAAYDIDRRRIARHTVDTPESCSDSDPMS